MKKILTILLLCSAFLVYSQEEDDFFSEDFDFEDMDMDEIFGDEGDESFIEVVEDKSDEVAEPSSELLTTIGVEWGGSLSSSISTGLSYSDFPKADQFFDEDYYTENFSPTLSADLHFNARPTDSTRFFGKFTTDIPFYQSASVALEDTSTDDATDFTFADVQIPEIKIYELFTDFNYNNKLFFRVGKQNAKWGVGYFFSPADFLSLESIDPENPDADREGPIAIKMSMPFGLNNIYTYVTVPNSVFEDGDASISDLVLAPMVQVLLGDVELSSGFYFQKDSAKRLMLSGTYGTNFDFGKVSVFGEAVGLYGSDKTFITEEYLTETYDDKIFFNGTAGFMWSKTIAENDFSVAAQYFYNGEGYDNDSKVIKNVMSALNEDMSGIPLEYMANIASLATADLNYADLINRNQHYLGASFGISNLFDNEDLSISTFTMLNLVDVSGFVKPSITYTFFDDLSATLGFNFNVSDEGDEYYSDRFGFDLSVRLGGGSF